MNKKYLIKTIGDVLTFAIAINFYIWLFVAMFHDGQVTVYFNHFNEAIFEYILYIIILPIITYAVFVNVKTYRRRKNESKRNRKTPYRATTDN